MRRSLVWASRGLPFVLLVLQACIADETPNGDVTPDTGPTTGGTSTTGPGPADGSLDATHDALDAEADAPVDATVDAPVDATVDAGPAVAEKLSPASCPWSLAVSATKVYWTEVTHLGCATPTLRSSPIAGSVAQPAAIYTGVAMQSIPAGLVVTAGDVLFYSDNQGPTNNSLWKLTGDGVTRTQWGSNPAGPAGVATDGTAVFWGNSSGLFRTPVATKTEVTVLTGNLSGSVDNNPHSIAVDATNVYVALDGTGVKACAKGTTCDPTADAGPLPTTIANEADVRGIASDGTSVWFTAGMPSYTPGGKERLLRCPITGCAGGNGFLLAETSPAADGGGRHYGVLVDATNVYWATIEGTLYSCPKNAATKCTPTVLTTGAKPFGMAQDATYLYWADLRGGIYRFRKP